jgi:hypothetical protein
MSAAASNWHRRQKIADHTLNAVLRAVCWRANNAGECWASQGTLSNETGLTDRCIRASLGVLELLGVVSRKRRSKGKEGRTTDLIQVHLDRQFDLSKAAIQAVRKSLKSRFATGTKFQLQESLQPEPGSSATGTGFQGYNKDNTYPNQVRDVSPLTSNVELYDGGVVQGGDRPRLRVVNGGKL